MIYREIVHSCSNTHVARAAVDSIGGEFARDFAEAASRRAMTRGAWAAHLVREFADSADETEWWGMVAATQGSEHPVLSGLRYILERPEGDRPREAAPPAWMICAQQGAL